MSIAASRSSACSAAAMPPFVSQAPRPTRRPPSILGSADGPPTVSVWPSITSVGYASSRWSDAITFGRPGSTSSKTTSHPIARAELADPLGNASLPAVRPTERRVDARDRDELRRNLRHPPPVRLPRHPGEDELLDELGRPNCCCEPAIGRDENGVERLRERCVRAVVHRETEIEGRTKRGRRELRPMKVQRRCLRAP